MFLAHLTILIISFVMAEIVLPKKPKKNPDVDTSFLPDRDREVRKHIKGAPCSKYVVVNINICVHITVLTLDTIKQGI